MASEKDLLAQQYYPVSSAPAIVWKPRRWLSLPRFLILGAVCTLITLAVFSGDIAEPGLPGLKPPPKEIYKCQPPLPSLLTYFPLTADDPEVRRALHRVDALLSRYVRRDDMDALSVNVVQGGNVLFAQGYGVQRANETTGKGKVNQDTVFRIASITKLFVTLQLLVLRDQGLVNLDDDIKTFYPEFEIGKALDSRQDDDDEDLHITLRTLAAQLSGLPRDMSTLGGGGGGGDSEEYIVLSKLKHERLVVPPYTFPIYSNTGFSLLGNALRRAVVLADPTRANVTLDELLREKVLAPLGMGMSGYQVEEEMRGNLAVPRNGSNQMAELDFGWNKPAGGMYSTARDLTKLLTTVLLTPHPILLPRRTLREWLRPLSSLPDSRTEVGLTWEITKLHPSYTLTGREPRLYSKSGNLPGYHSELTVRPDLGLGVVVLMTGDDSDAAVLVDRVLEVLEPVVERKWVEKVKKRYVGTYVGGEGNRFKVGIGAKDVLSVMELVVNGTDLLAIVGSKEVALWSTGRLDEFRLAFGRDYLNTRPKIGCQPYWMSFDNMRVGDDNTEGAAFDRLVFEPTGKKDRKGREGVRAVYPAGGVTWERMV
ncbi:hypothetical protein BC938DRAFT_482746 [Jimgerdemannia flammicorona]|uniref:Beta-lactamase-related domain-containing protein n=1 Tax=Jimgerdemannia flammicorona TaxID=994334 RepID=A0A433QDD8_9FUNG|nr:hypothetical protein BC938DRAFT_482746 [Jimgerdemannia flammicorona]